tara:strand:+ start:284 stop:532 length:249 start_codon:yes stop_codon:yes gene_type:complete
MKKKRERERAFIRFCRCYSPFDVLLSLLKSSSAPFASLRLRHFFLSLKTVGHPSFFSTRRATTQNDTEQREKDTNDAQGRNN